MRQESCSSRCPWQNHPFFIIFFKSFTMLFTGRPVFCASSFTSQYSRFPRSLTYFLNLPTEPAILIPVIAISAKTRVNTPNAPTPIWSIRSRPVARAPIQRRSRNTSDAAPNTSPVAARKIPPTLTEVPLRYNGLCFCTAVPAYVCPAYPVPC